MLTHDLSSGLPRQIPSWKRSKDYVHIFPRRNTRSDHYFTDDQGKKVADASYESFMDLVYNKKVGTESWHIHFNFNAIKKKDDLFIIQAMPIAA